MDINFILEFVNLIVLGICLCVGYVIKNSLDFIPNKYIPLIMLVLGALINISINVNNGITAEVVLSGMFSGLASTGLHQIFKNIINKEGE